MQWYLIAVFSWYDPAAGTAVSEWVREPHSTLESCRMAKDELRILFKALATCFLQVENGIGPKTAPGSLRRRFQLAAIHPPTEPLPATKSSPRGK